MARFTSIIVLAAILGGAAAQTQIQAGANGKCLGVYVPADGQSLVVVPCNDPRTNLEWVYTQPGDNPSGIQLTSNDGPLCLDAGTSPHNNGQVVVKTCAPGTASQHWYFTADNRIAITGGDQCLDYPSVGPVQTYKCTTGNTNQVWKPRFTQ